ncbi:carboxymuconolactone decarboxylase family protein [Planomonospora venezuelensis]|uniref:AhpD family alkylhydroperoxidase n=1 Tax=Planomonospora venezuelensis TaxID=1999 RepID=A0A841D9I2_PLAVE|nr:carboxymuconolactone decarboxylase family protein [Planomonospora venezuelensis]MBB5965144.1 AhpD family alkylhydroperoxidase [Planomonospora venezuelensis]GIN00421.1 alkyl hydroperoxide reductase AhpD [Planomonospora venezuelensis]
MCYKHPSDLKLIPRLRDLAPAEASAFLEFHSAAGRSGGAVPPRYRELIAVGVALTTQCEYCIDTHTRQAREAGATAEELAEAALVAAAVRAGGTLAHALLMIRLHDEAVADA